MTEPVSNESPATPSRRHLLGCDPAEINHWLADAGHERYRTNQILSWIYEKGAADFSAMSNLSKLLRAWLTENAALYTSNIARESVAEDGTRKLLLQFPDGATTETVWIPEEDRHTACLSTQVGCPVGCRFCASGIDGLQRNLTAGEIVEQAMRIRQLIADAAGNDSSDKPVASIGGFPSRAPRLSHIVIMGMGEPLANYDALVKALRIINAEWGLGIGARKITVSTVGLPKQIRMLAHEDLQLNLALSLHAPDNMLRQELIPWARGVKLEDLLDACQYYFKSTGREVTLEYVLLDGVNMFERHAEALAKIAKRLRANVNLLRYNPVEGLEYRRPSSEDTYKFQGVLRGRGVNVHVRKSRGRDVNAACGQLRRAAEEAS